MGAAVWEYLWMLDHVTSDEPDGKGEFSGIVAYGKPISAETVAHDLQESIDTAKVNLRRLTEVGYVERKRVVGCGYSYLVTKSKKWIWKRANGHRVENPPMEKPADDRVGNPPMIGKKPADDRVGNPSNNKEEKTLLRVKKSKPSSPDGEADPRHSAIRALIQQLHLKQFCVMCQWDGSEGKTLSVLLASNPSWTEEQIACMVRNRFTSEGINSARPRKWLGNISDYAAGPLDRYRNLLGKNGNGTNRAAQRQASNLAALDAAFPMDR